MYVQHNIGLIPDTLVELGCKRVNSTLEVGVNLSAVLLVSFRALRGGVDRHLRRLISSFGIRQL